MGGCASRPKDADFRSEDVPIDAPVTPTKAEVQPTAHEDNTVGDESEKKEEPLLDASEPKEEKESQAAPVADTESQEAPAKDED